MGDIFRKALRIHPRVFYSTPIFINKLRVFSEEGNLIYNYKFVYIVQYLELLASFSYCTTLCLMPRVQKPNLLIFIKKDNEIFPGTSTWKRLNDDFNCRNDLSQIFFNRFINHEATDRNSVLEDKILLLNRFLFEHNFQKTACLVSI